MKDIKMLVDLIDCELDDARKYAALALEVKPRSSDMGKLFYDLSLKELQDKDKLHSQVASLISTYRSKNGEPPAPMMAVYNYLHKKQMERAAEVSGLLAQYSNA